ncbi:hypothetical protein WA577_005148 [Blastocystis sp. JDR]
MADDMNPYSRNPFERANSLSPFPPLSSLSPDYSLSNHQFSSAPISASFGLASSRESDSPFLMDYPVSRSLQQPLGYSSCLDMPSYTQPSYYPPNPYSQPSFYPSSFGYRQPSQRMSAQTRSFVPRSVSSASEDPNIIHLDKVRSGEDKRTTLMIRNIPNGFSRKVLLKIINQTCKNRFDFLYLPFDEKTNCNMGYGYVNMIDLESVCLLYENFNGHKWPHTKSGKVCSVCYGRLQSGDLGGSEKLVQYCSDWSVMTSDEIYHPLFFRKTTKRINNKDVVVMEPFKPKVNFSMRSN